MKYPVSVLLLLLVIAVASCSKPATTPAPPAPKPAADPKPPATPAADFPRVFEETCTKCHSLKRVQEYKGSDDWAAIVDRMVNVNGAKIAPEQVPQIVAYLGKTYPRK